MITNNARVGLHGKINPELSEKSSIQQEEGSFQQQIELQFKEEAIKVLNLGCSFVWC
jgi:hypothetical protein